MDKNRLIGISKNNRLPWENKDDLKFLKEMTQGKDVLMGHITYLSLKSYYKKKPLPFGTIYVANLEEYNYPDAVRIKDLKRFLENEQYNLTRDLFVMGGATIYSLTFEYSLGAFVTQIDREYNGDVYLPYNVNYDTEDFLVASELQLNEYTKMTFYVSKKFEVNKLIIKAYVATWCGPCKMMKNELKKIQDEDGIEVQYIDVDENKELVKSMGINSIPTITFVKGETEIFRSSGFVPKNVLLQKFRGVQNESN